MFSDIPTDQIEEHLKGIEIPAIPEVIEEALRLRNEPSVSLKEVVELIQKDTALTASVIKTVNSPFYGLRQKVRSIAHATSLLGINNLFTLVMTIAFKNQFGQQSDFMRDFWKQSTRIAQILAFLARELRLFNPEEAYVLGLMCNCAVPILAKKDDRYGKAYVREHRNDPVRIIDAENSQFSVNHATLGYFTLRRWEFPPEMYHTVQIHHSQSLRFEHGEEQESVLRMTCGLKIAESILNEESATPHYAEWIEKKDAIYSFIDVDPELIARLEIPSEV